MSDSQTNFTLTDPAIEPIDLNRMDEFLFSAMLRASIHLGGSHTPLQLSRMVRKSLLKLSLEIPNSFLKIFFLVSFMFTSSNVFNSIT